MMEIIMEFLFELIFEGSIELSQSKKVSKWIRYPLIGMITLFFLGVEFLLFFLGVSIWNKNKWASLFIMVVGIILVIGSILKFRELYIEKGK